MKIVYRDMPVPKEFGRAVNVYVKHENELFHMGALTQFNILAPGTLEPCSTHEIEFFTDNSTRDEYSHPLHLQSFLSDYYDMNQDFDSLLKQIKEDFVSFDDNIMKDENIRKKIITSIVRVFKRRKEIEQQKKMKVVFNDKIEKYIEMRRDLNGSINYLSKKLRKKDDFRSREKVEYGNLAIKNLDEIIDTMCEMKILFRQNEDGYIETLNVKVSLREDNWLKCFGRIADIFIYDMNDYENTNRCVGTLMSPNFPYVDNKCINKWYYYSDIDERIFSVKYLKRKTIETDLVLKRQLKHQLKLFNALPVAYVNLIKKYYDALDELIDNMKVYNIVKADRLINDNYNDEKKEDNETS